MMLLLLLLLIGCFQFAVGGKSLKDTKWDVEEYQCALCIAVYSDVIDGTRSFEDACSGIVACNIVKEGISIIDNNARSSCQSAGHCAPQKAPQGERKAVLHIGPPKTATTYIQTTLSQLEPELLEMNYMAPRFEGHKANEKEFPQFLKVYFLQALEMNMDIIISAEYLSRYRQQEIAALAVLVEKFKVSVVFSYREIISHFISAYNQLAKTQPVREPFVGYLMNVLATFDTYDPSIIRKWGNQFGTDNVTVLDYYGIQTEDRDIFDVLVCEAAGIWCDTTSKELLKGKFVADNASPDSVEFITLFNAVIYRAGGSDCDVEATQLAGLLEYVRTNVESARAHSKVFPMATQHFESLHPYAEQLEIDLRAGVEAAGIRWLYSNPEANRSKRETAVFLEMSSQEMLYDPFWDKWFTHFMDQMPEDYIHHCK